MISMAKGKRIALGMSGGVDSSVAVALLLREGYDVLGVTLRFQHGEDAETAATGARAVCDRFGVEHVTVDCSEDFERCVVSRFARDYAEGLTPSPCVGCNAIMKIPELLRVADQHDCALVATGHYARVSQLAHTGRFAILTALDPRKDQSYMLCQLTQDQLACLVLPLGGLTKPEVRFIAAELGLVSADAPDSQDICFAPQGYRALLEQRGITAQPGNIVNRAGEVVGKHTGLFDYTIGQRKGIGVAGPEPYYVVKKRVTENELVIGTLAESKISTVRVARMNWQAIEAPAVSRPSASNDLQSAALRNSVEAMVKLRYRSEPCPCIIEAVDTTHVLVRLRSPQSATAPGQYAVFYQGSTVLGGGVIQEVD